MFEILMRKVFQGAVIGAIAYTIAWTIARVLLYYYQLWLMCVAIVLLMIAFAYATTKALQYRYELNKRIYTTFSDQRA